MGVSAGFLTSVVVTAGSGEINVDLSLETRQAILRTYPAVERKYLEVVPHEMKEEEFWEKLSTVPRSARRESDRSGEFSPPTRTLGPVRFPPRETSSRKLYESHYFHRERSETNPKDTFFDCLKLDEQDMQLIQAQSAAIVKRQRDLSNLDDDLGLISEMAGGTARRGNQVPAKGSLAKALLLRRCNYHSERILEDIKNGSAQAATVNGGATEEGQQASTRQFDLELDSHELQQLTDGDAGMEAPRKLDLKPAAAVSATVGEEELEMEKRHRELGRECAENSIFNLIDSAMVSRSDRFMDMLVDMEDAAGDAGEPMANGNADGEAPTMHDLSPASMEEVRTVHHCPRELLRHYWRCHPLTTPKSRDKARRMVDSLLRFEKEVIDGCGAKYGEFSVEHCRFMLDKAKTHYENTTRQQK